MDLEAYKKTWSKHPKDNKSVSTQEIYKLMFTKSSSIIKWIFIIGLIEFSIMILFFFVDTNTKDIENLGLLPFYKVFNAVSFFVVFIFMVKFYLNYKSISALDNTKTLMNKIVKTRKTVRNYIFTGLSFMAIFMIVAAFSVLSKHLENTTSIKVILFIIIIVISAIAIGIVWLIYQLIYGILLKKLNINYKELKKLNDLN